MNRLIPVIGAIVLAIAIVAAIATGRGRPEPAVIAHPSDAPAPDVDTPADTVRSLAARVAKLTEHTRKLTEENERLRLVNRASAESEARVTENVRKTLQDELRKELEAAERAAASNNNDVLLSLKTRVEQLRSQVSQLASAPKPATPAVNTPGDMSGDMPVGFGFAERSVEPIYWIKDLTTDGDAPVEGANAAPGGLTTPTSFGSAGSLLHNSSPGTSRTRDAADKPHHHKHRDRDQDTTSIPVYTIPANATLMNSTAFSALVGRVPIGGNVHDPMPIKVLIGADNLAANGHFIPGLQGLVMSGYAVGDWTLACVRGTLDSATFIFQDGHMQTFGVKNKRLKGKGNGENKREQIGYISDRFGVPCISGKRISNAPQYLAARAGVMALSAAAEAIAAAETTNVVGDTGVGTSSVTGDQGRYVLGRTVSGTASEISNWLAERQAQSFDAIFVPAGKPVTVHIDSTLKIDYRPDGRMLDHHARVTRAGADRDELD